MPTLYLVLSALVRMHSVQFARFQEPWKPGTEVVALYNFKGNSKEDLPFSKREVLMIVKSTRVGSYHNSSVNKLKSPWKIVHTVPCVVFFFIKNTPKLIFDVHLCSSFFTCLSYSQIVPSSSLVHLSYLVSLPSSLRTSIVSRLFLCLFLFLYLPLSILFPFFIFLPFSVSLPLSLTVSCLVHCSSLVSLSSLYQFPSLIPPHLLSPLTIFPHSSLCLPLPSLPLSLSLTLLSSPAPCVNTRDVVGSNVVPSEAVERPGRNDPSQLRPETRGGEATCHAVSSLSQCPLQPQISTALSILTFQHRSSAV